MSSEVETVRNDRASRYEGRVGGEVVTVVDFVRAGSVLIVTHTVTDPAHRGQGLAALVTRAALEDIRSRAEQVRALCPFTVTYLRTHPEFADLQV